MEILIYVVVYAIAIALSTAILAGSLFLVEKVEESSFKEFGAWSTLARGTAIVTITTLLGLVPGGIFLAIVVWFLGIMFLFQKSFGQTFLLLVVNWLASLGVTGALAWVLSGFLSA